MFDTTMLGSGKRKVSLSIIDTTIPLKSLKKHAILGAGTFGQVWLVSKDGADGIPRPYALKIQSKYELVESAQAKGVVTEKNIMQQLKSPFIINLVASYQDNQYVYMLLGLVQGGELFSLLHQPSYDGVSEADAKFYAAGILEGISYMHRRQILYRDLKPENILIDNEGYPVVVDLGFAKYVPAKTYTLCGTPLYLAPEVILNRGHDKGADHWSFAILLYEMISGYTPFYTEGMDQIALFRFIVKGGFQFPAAAIMSPEVEDLISKFLVVEPSKRLGSLALGIDEIYHHIWFTDIDFSELRRKEVTAPWVPIIKDPLDTANFENWDHLTDKTLSNDPPINAANQEIFETF
jgi:serine/threonine protein kinase